MAKLYKLESQVAALSPARQRLKNLLDQRAACEKRAESLRVARSRLTAPVKEAEAATAELAAFDAQNAEAVSNWARNGLAKGERPLVDSDRRQTLIIAKQTSAENAAAAKAADEHLVKDIAAEGFAAASLTADIEMAIAEVIAENCDFEDLADAHRALIAKQSRINEAVATIVEIAHGGERETMRPTFVLLQGLLEKVRISAAAPAVVTAGADHALWKSLKARLRTDPAAELEG
jgi:hypothetical protein